MTGAEQPPQPHPADPAPLIALLTLEYEQLKDEQLKRIATRDGLIYATLASLMLGTWKAAATPPLLLVLPLAVVTLGWTYLANDRKISEIGRYIRSSLGPQLKAHVPGSQPFGWESQHRQSRDRRRHKIGQLLVDLTVFCLSATAALALFWIHSPEPPTWAIAVMTAEAAMTVGLAYEITRSADLQHLSAPDPTT